MSIPIYVCVIRGHDCLVGLSLLSSFGLGGPTLASRSRTPGEHPTADACLALTLWTVDPETFQRMTWHASFPPLTQQLTKHAGCRVEGRRHQADRSRVRHGQPERLGVVAVPFKSGNADCPGGCAVHTGFLQSWESIASEVMETLAAALDASVGYTTAISGYSLGGALACLARTSTACWSFGRQPGRLPSRYPREW